jgi:LPS-assembly lipoprotein
MSSPDLARRTALRLGVSAALALSLAGCFRPLYGPTASGADMRATLQAIEVAPIDGRFGHYLRQELVFELDGSGQPQAKRYELVVTTRERVQSPIVDTVTGRADAATLVIEADYVLRDPAADKVITSGKAVGNASYDRSQQRFANVRAARDAEIRLAKSLAEQIRVRISAALASGG